MPASKTSTKPHRTASLAVAKTIAKSPAAAATAAAVVRIKDLSFSFRAECMADATAVFAALLKSDEVMRSVCHYSATSKAPFDDVVGVLVFRLYGSDMRNFLGAVDAALSAMSDVEDEIHVVLETLNFTPEYDGERTYTGELREELMDRIEERLADIDFIEFK